MGDMDMKQMNAAAALSSANVSSSILQDFDVQESHCRKNRLYATTATATAIATAAKTDTRIWDP